MEEEVKVGLDRAVLRAELERLWGRERVETVVEEDKTVDNSYFFPTVKQFPESCDLPPIWK